MNLKKNLFFAFVLLTPLVVTAQDAHFMNEATVTSNPDWEIVSDRVWEKRVSDREVLRIGFGKEGLFFALEEAYKEQEHLSHLLANKKGRPDFAEKMQHIDTLIETLEDTLGHIDDKLPVAKSQGDCDNATLTASYGCGFDLTEAEASVSQYLPGPLPPWTYSMYVYASASGNTVSVDSDSFTYRHKCCVSLSARAVACGNVSTNSLALIISSGGCEDTRVMQRLGNCSGTCVGGGL